MVWILVEVYKKHNDLTKENISNQLNGNEMEMNIDNEEPESRFHVKDWVGNLFIKYTVVLKAKGQYSCGSFDM